METKECPFATHILHFKCGKCELIDLVFCKDAKQWKCPRCTTSDQYRPSGSAMNEEINTWRNFFLDDIFQGSLKHIPEGHKNRIRIYFMAIPSESFTKPLFELHKCISAVLQHMEDRK
jgi:ribosomal protein S27E